MSVTELKEISYKEASALLFINSEKKDTHTFTGSFGACWKTAELRKAMRKNKLFFSLRPYIFGGHQVVMVTPENKVYWIETATEKVKKYLETK